MSPGCDCTEKESDVEPQCSRVNILEANKFNLNAGVLACEDGKCPDELGSKVSTAAQQAAYGPGSEFKIDTTKPFKVDTHFHGCPKMEELVKIETHLIQGDKVVKLIQEDKDFLKKISNQLELGSSMVISNFNGGDIQADINGGQCQIQQECGAYTTTYSNFSFRMEDSVVNPVAEKLIIEDIAPKLSDCDDASLCSGCSRGWMTSDPSSFHYLCTDYTQYKYVNKCDDNTNLPNFCGKDDKNCYMSYPADLKKFDIDEAACRPLPERYINNTFTYSESECKDGRGLCAEGCGDSTCNLSWIAGNPLK